MIMGGVRNLIETHVGSLFANITPNTHLTGYQTSELASSTSPRNRSKTGWQYICLEEEWTRGYLQEIQDFMECVATGRQPLADLALAFETTKVNYAGYWAADEGRRVGSDRAHFLSPCGRRHVARRMRVTAAQLQRFAETPHPASMQTSKPPSHKERVHRHCRRNRNTTPRTPIPSAAGIQDPAF